MSQPFTVYLGQTRDPKYLRRLAELGVGECTQRGELPPRRTPWFYDNAAFRDWKADKPFQVVRFQRDMRRIRDLIQLPARPDFVVVPDKVGAGIQSLEWSRMWREDVPPTVRAYLAVQDGVTWAEVNDYLVEAASRGVAYDGIFVGGSLPWKLETAQAWCEGAHQRRIKCHVGRVGTPDRLRHAAQVWGADSVDSSLPLLQGEEYFNRFLAVVADIRAKRPIVTHP